MKSYLYIPFFAITCLFILISGCADNDKVVLSAPTSVTAEAGNGRLTVAWLPAYGASSYAIYISDTPGKGKNGVRYETASSPRIVMGLENGTIYYLVVTSIAGEAESLVSSEISGMPIPIPSPPVSLNGAGADSEVVLSWNSQAGESYRIYWAYTQGISVNSYEGLFDSVTSPFKHSGLSNGTPYYYVIIASNDSGESAESAEISVTPEAPSGNNITIRGRLNYQDREYDSYGFTGIEEFKPVRYVAVEAVDSSSGDVLGNGSTDGFGNYSVVFAASSSVSLYIRAISETVQAGEPAVQVLTLGELLFSVAGSYIEAAPGMELNSILFLPLTLGASGAFNILDVTTAGGEFVKSLSAITPPLLKVYWQEWNEDFGTWYCNDMEASAACRFGEGIYLLGGDSSGGGDHDEYDDDVILHEYAHFVAYNFSQDDSPGGVHFISSNDLDLRLAWSEGWGDFFPAAIKSRAIAGGETFLSSAKGMDETLYLDTRGTSLFTFDIARPAFGMRYSSNEVAVANVLWNVMTGTLEGMEGIWGAIGEYIPNIHDATKPVNLEAFWDGWIYNEAPMPPERSDLEGFFEARGIDYSADLFETDSSATPARKLAVGSSEIHTLYEGDDPAVNDGDYIAFDALYGLSYVISTSELTNGADTYLRLIDRDGFSILDENDNGIPDQAYTSPYNLSLLDGIYHENDGTTLASSIIFTPYSSGTYYIEVSSSMSRPESAGRYGSYRLKLASF